MKTGAWVRGGLIPLWALIWSSACGDDAVESTSDASIVRQDGSVDAGEDAAVVTACQPDEGGAVPERDSYDEWTKVELPGTSCSDGSQYKFFVNFSESSNNLVVIFEPGGACWDFESCSGNTPLGAANPDGIPDDHMALLQHLHPHAGGMFGDDGAFADWNKVFVPYCTGDVHSGSRVATYTSDDGEELEYRHVGYDNMLEVTGWLDETFEDVPRLVATGCSAGGVGALLNYHLLRSRIDGVQCGYLLNDSGPLFHSDGPSGPLHEQVRQAFGSDATIDLIADELGQAAGDAVSDDFGALNTVLADAYPSDRLALAVYQRDLNYSLYSYDSFFDSPPYEMILDNWEQDLASIRETYDTRDNLGYYMPRFRPDNCSHCATIIPLDQVEGLGTGEVSPWLGSEIEEHEVTLPEYIDSLLDDDEPLPSYLESDASDGEFTEDEIDECRE